MTAHSTIAKPTDRAAWLQARVPYFNASAAAALFDRHPYMTAADYATEKLTGGDTDDDNETSAMRRGRYFENGIAQWWAHEYGVHVTEPRVLYIADRFMATVDRLVVETDRPVEIKTAKGIHDEPMEHWLDQCQAIMWCVDAEHLELVWVDGSLTLKHQTIDADFAAQVALSERAERFMAAIDLGIVPDWVSGSLTASNVAELHPDPSGSVDLGEAGLVAMERYGELKRLVSAYMDEMDEIRDAVARMLGEHEAGTYLGDEIVTWKRSKDSLVFDRDEFERDQPETFAKYQMTKPGSRRFLAKTLQAEESDVAAGPEGRGW